MKIILLHIAIPAVSTQLRYWTWISGSSGVHQSGSYSEKGSPSPNVYPGARSNHAGVIHPLTNEFVLHGGVTTTDYLNDLWSYNFNTNQWTWISGSTGSVNYNYGTLGTTSSSNVPGNRANHAIDISPITGLLVMFGGFGYFSSGNGYLNDFWTFNFNTNMWTWVSGSNLGNQPGVYGTKGVASAGNIPGGRWAHSMDIHPQTENVIVFGGTGSGNVYFNDLWSFNMNTKHWTWLSGSSSTNQIGFYGSKGVSSASNVPDSRAYHASVINSQSGNLFIFGGSFTVIYNDLWTYNFISNQWTWISGYNVGDRPAVHGTQGVPSPSNQPGSRDNVRISYSSSRNSLILFGGSAGNWNFFNDAWLYNLTTNEWVWIAGSNQNNQPGVYGTIGIADAANIPGARNSFAFDCSDTLQKCGLIGGNLITGKANDLWNLDLVNGPVVSATSFLSTSHSIRTSEEAGKHTSKISTTFHVSSRSITSSTAIVFPTITSILASTSKSLMTSEAFLTTTELVSNTSARFSSTIELMLSSEYIEATENSQIITIESNQLSSSESEYIEATENSQIITKESNQLSSSESEASIFKPEISLYDIPDFTTLKPNSKSSGVQVKSITNIYETYKNYAIIGGLLFVSLMLGLISLKCWRRNRRRNLRSTSNTKSSNVTSKTDSSKTIVTSTGNSTTSTQVATNQGISIPGYLRVELNKDFRINREIARGGMGSVSLGDSFKNELKIFGNVIIVKQMLTLTLTERHINLFYQEVSIMSYLSPNRNIAKLLGYSDNPYCLLMKFYKYGSLDGWLYSVKTVKTIYQLLLFTLDICHGVEAMHSKDFVHCDLKPQNVLIDWDSRQQRLFCVLTDFGITQIVSDKNLLVKAFEVVNVVGLSLYYASPEAIIRRRLKKNIAVDELFKFDIYAIGVIIYELVNRVRPWE